MTDKDLEGSEVLERLAEAGLLDAFYEAVDSDDLGRAKALLKQAGVDATTIARVLREMKEASDP
jgi:hypothetical protein